MAVGYHLHELALIPTAEEDGLFEHLGPDLLGADWDAAEAVRRIAEKPDASIAEALLTSAIWPAWATSTRPRRCSCAGCGRGRRSPSVPNLDRTVKLAQRLVASNKGRWTQTTDRFAAAGRDQLCLRQAGPAVPALRHRDPERLAAAGKRGTEAAQDKKAARGEKTAAGASRRARREGSADKNRTAQDEKTARDRRPARDERPRATRRPRGREGSPRRDSGATRRRHAAGSRQHDRRTERAPTLTAGRIGDKAELDERVTYWCPRCQPEPAAAAPE